MSATLGYHTLLAIVPAIGLIFWYLKSIGLSDNWINLTRKFLLLQLNINSGSMLIDYFDKLTSPARDNSWGWVGLALVIYTTYNLISKFGQSLDSILETGRDHPHIERRGLIRLGVRRALIMVLLPIGLISSLVITQWLKDDSWLRYLINIKTVGPLIALPLPWLVDIVAFFLVFYFVPRSRVPAKQALKAALIVGPTSEIVRMIFGYYTVYTVGLHKIYGVFVVVPLFILWIQIAWIIILLGALSIRFKPKHIAERPLPQT